MQFVRSSSVISHYTPPIIQFYEYTLEGELTLLYEEKINFITEQMNVKSTPLTLVKYWDEMMDTSLDNDKKKRTTILVSDMFIGADYLKNTFFKDCELNITCFFKQRVI
jgi:hypothetical protein